MTNGVTPRRFVGLANPGLSRLITATIGDGWLRDLDRLQRAGARTPTTTPSSGAFAAIKGANKVRLAGLLERRDGITLDPERASST